MGQKWQGTQISSGERMEKRKKKPCEKPGSVRGQFSSGQRTQCDYDLGCITSQKSDCGSVALKYLIQFLLLEDRIHHTSMETKLNAHAEINPTKFCHKLTLN